MAKKTHLLTDNVAVHGQSLATLEKAVLVAERKKHQRQKVLRSDDTKIEVVKTFLALGGNLSLTAAATAIPYYTLKDWKATSWWKGLVTEIKQSEKLELSAKTKRILDKAMDVLADRVMNGDFIYDQKAGQLVRKPITAKDAHTISMDLIDRTALLDKTTEEGVDTKDRDLARLEALAEKFAKLANKIDTRPTIEVTDVVFVEEKPNA